MLNQVFAKGSDAILFCILTRRNNILTVCNVLLSSVSKQCSYIALL